MGQKYAALSAEGLATGFFDDALHAAIPAGAVPIDDATWAAWIEAPHALCWDGAALVPYSPSPSAEAVAAAARRRRDAALATTAWLVQRHRDQVDAGTATTLTVAQYVELLAWRQALREWPQQPGWPDLPLPEAPAWLDAG